MILQYTCKKDNKNFKDIKYPLLFITWKWKINPNRSSYIFKTKIEYSSEINLKTKFYNQYVIQIKNH